MKIKNGKIRVLSGIRATQQSVHIGNLLGAIRGMEELQNDPRYETFYMVADLHAITEPFKPDELRRNRLEIAKDYLAAGIDPKKSILFLQSDVPEHTEFSYLLSSVIRKERLNRLPAYKGKDKKKMTLAALTYPVLMAADILLYKAERVPIGEDQIPHLEIAQEIARAMNRLYKTNFSKPEQYKTFSYLVPGLAGKGKMSKSVPGSYIQITDDLKTIRQRLAAAPTDPGRGKSVPEEGGVANLLKLVELFQGKEKRRKYEKDYVSTGIQYEKELKSGLANAIYKELRPIQIRRAELEKDPEYVKEVLKKGAVEARKVAKKTLVEVKRAMGLT